MGKDDITSFHVSFAFYRLYFEQERVNFIFFLERKIVIPPPPKKKTLCLTGAALAQVSEEHKFLLERALCLTDVGAWSKAEDIRFQSRLLTHLGGQALPSPGWRGLCSLEKEQIFAVCVPPSPGGSATTKQIFNPSNECSNINM